jgi:hypothetical protein
LSDSLSQFEWLVLWPGVARFVTPDRPFGAVGLGLAKVHPAADGRERQLTGIELGVHRDIRRGQHREFALSNSM